jgi:hypothetical protein
MNIDHKDATQHSIIINDKSYDTSTSVVLSGTHVVNYGYDLHSSLLHILEHFCGDIEPYNSIPGQLWYDRLNDKLNVNTNNGYVELGYTRPPVLPSNATTSDILKIKLEDLLSVNGGTMRGALILKDMKDNDPENAAVSKKYIDSKMISAPVGLIPIRGNDEPAGRLHINDIPSKYDDSPMIAANKNYVDKVIPHIDVIGPTSVTASDNSDGKNTIVTFHQSELLYIYGQHTLTDVNNNKSYALVVLTNAYIKAASVQINIFDGDSIIAGPKLPTLSGIVRNIGDSIVLYVRYFGKSYSNLTFNYAITGIVKTIQKSSKSKTLNPFSLITADELANKSPDELSNLKDQYDWSNSQLYNLSNDQLGALGTSLMTLDTTLVNTVTPTIGGYINIYDTRTLAITINGVTYTKDDININGANRWFINIPPKNLLTAGNSYDVSYNLNNGVDVSIGSFSVSTSAEIVLVDPSDGHKFILSQKDGDSHGTWDECVSFAGLSNTNRIYGYADWRLPSKSELQTIFNNLVSIKVDNTFAPYKYWANDSTTDTAWCINYGTGVINECQKQYSNFVRLVRNV